MIDTAQIILTLRKNFHTSREVKVDPQTGHVDVDGEVDSIASMKKLPVQFGRVSGDFDISGINLISLRGAPNFVGEDFYCNNNHLHSLQGAPSRVEGDFKCYGNKIESLQYGPEWVGGQFDCSDNHLMSLLDAPRHVGGHFICSDNKLETLVGAPDIILRDFMCEGNLLNGLQGLPSQIQGTLWIVYHKHLPLLRLCTCRKFNIDQAPKAVQKIMNAHAGTGRAGALKAAAELIRTGYQENARW